MEEFLLMIIFSVGGLVLLAEFAIEVGESLMNEYLIRIIQYIGAIFLVLSLPGVYLSMHLNRKSLFKVNDSSLDLIVFQSLSWLFYCFCMFMLANIVFGWWSLLFLHQPTTISLTGLLATIFMVSSFYVVDASNNAKLNAVGRTLDSVVSMKIIRSFRAFVSMKIILLFMAIGAGLLAELHMVRDKSTQRALFEGGLSLALFIVVVFNTYGMGGRLAQAAANEKEIAWSFWQPFVGGVLFVCLQIGSWVLFGVSVVLALGFIVSTLAVGMEIFLGVTAVAGACCMLSEVLMILSIMSFQPATIATTTAGIDNSNKLTISIPLMLEKFARSMQELLVVVLIVNVQYVVFLLAFPLFLLSSLPPQEMVLHWFAACGVIVIHAIFCMLLNKRFPVSEETAKTDRVVLPGFVSSIGLSSAAAGLLLARCPKELVFLASIPWVLFSGGHAAYVLCTFSGHPEFFGHRCLFSRQGMTDAKGEESILRKLLTGIGDKVRGYFRGRLLKESDLDPSKTYVFGFHPHGVMPITLFWVSTSSAWHSLFPGISFCALTASVLHIVPVMRDLMQWTGGRDVSRSSFRRALASDKSCMLVPGGQAEMMESRSGDSELRILTKHSGFIRLAMQEGAALVPVLSFREVDILDNVRMPAVQKWFLDRIAVAVPHYPHGDFFLPIPRRVPVTVVVGTPISVTKCEKPSEEDVGKVKQAYVAQLQRLFDKYREEAGELPERRLVFIS